MRGWTLDVAQLGVLWQRLNLHDPPPGWGRVAREYTGDDPAAQLRAAAAALERSGLVDEAGIPEPALARALRTLSRAELLLELRFAAADGPETRAVLAVGAKAGALGVLCDGLAGIEPVTGDGVSALLDVLPYAEPSRGRKLELPAAVVARGRAAAAGRGNDSDIGVGDELALLGVARRDVRALQGLIGGRRVGYGQLAVTRRRPMLDPQRCPDIVHLVETTAGRSVLWTWDGVLRAAPATYERVASLVQRLQARPMR